MKVFVGKFQYVYDGDIDIVVATTKDRIERELIKMAEQYVEVFDTEERMTMVGNPQTFDDWQQVGWDNEWFSLEWILCNVHSDGHILKYAMETI